MSRTAEATGLVAAARAGDREAFGRLHQIYAPVIHGLLLGWVPRSSADDLTQDVFLSAMQQLGKLREDAAFSGWLTTIARNRARDHHRRTRREQPLPAELAGINPPTAEAEEALAAIRSLPAAYRETLILRLVEGLTGPEIALRTGMTAGSVRVNLHRGMKLLRSKLGAEEGSHE